MSAGGYPSASASVVAYHNAAKQILPVDKILQKNRTYRYKIKLFAEVLKSAPDKPYIFNENRCYMNIANENQTCTIALKGELDHHAANTISLEVRNAIDLNLPKRMRLDFSGITFMDSSGIGVVISAFKRMREVDGTLEIFGVSRQACKIFNAAQVQKIVKIEMLE